MLNMPFPAAAPRRPNPPIVFRDRCPWPCGAARPAASPTLRKSAIGDAWDASRIIERIRVRVYACARAYEPRPICPRAQKILAAAKNDTGRIGNYTSRNSTDPLHRSPANRANHSKRTPR
jgi:hypothetical protein